MPSYFRVFRKEASLSISCYRKPVESRRGLGTVDLKGDIPRETRSSMSSLFRVVWKVPRFHVIVGLKDDIARKTVVVSKTPTS